MTDKTYPLSSKRNMKNDYFHAQICQYIIPWMSFCIFLFAYILSMLITVMLLRRSWPIMDIKDVLMWRKVLKDLSAAHEVAGIVARMEATFSYRTDEMSWRSFWSMVFTITAVFFSGMGPRSRSFQRLTSPRHRNLIQFACCNGLANRYLPHCAR